MDLPLISYDEHKKTLPLCGNHINACFDAENIVVYQAFSLRIGNYAVQNNCFGGDYYKFSRMTWIKTSFLWMMSRCGWGTKEGQEIVLAILIKREGFETLIKNSVSAVFHQSGFSSLIEWQKALKNSQIRLQWDPDKTPRGGNLERRTPQIGLSGEYLMKWNQEWIVEIKDISDFVSSSKISVDKKDYKNLLVPHEKIYTGQL